MVLSPTPCTSLPLGAHSADLAHHVWHRYVPKPVLLTKLSSYEAAMRIHTLTNKPYPLAAASGKREAAERLIDTYLDESFRNAALQDDPNTHIDVTPILFNHNMFAKARRDKQMIVLPEGLDIRVVTAAAELVARGLCNVTLCGDHEDIQACDHHVTTM